MFPTLHPSYQTQLKGLSLSPHSSTFFPPSHALHPSYSPSLLPNIVLSINSGLQEHQISSDGNLHN